MKRFIVIIFIFVVVFVIFSSTGEEKEPISFSSPSDYKGVNARLLRGDENTDYILKKAKEAGVTWIRTDFSWLDVDRGQDSKGNLLLDYSFPDFYVKEIVDKVGFNVLGILGGSPTWANGKSKENWKCGEPDYWHYMPNDPQNYGKYVEKMAGRYKNISAWEIWNEPNLYAFNPDVPNAQKYTRLLKSSYKAIKKVNPKALVVGGVLGDQPTGSIEVDATEKCGRKYVETNISPEDFLKQMYQSGAKSYFDALSIHLYGGTNFERLNKLRQIMLDNGDNKPIWITEIGFATCPDKTDHFCLTKDEQANKIATAYEELKKYKYVQRIFYFEFYDKNIPGDKFTYTGLLEGKGSNFKEKPSFKIFKRL